MVQNITNKYMKRKDWIDVIINVIICCTIGTLFFITLMYFAIRYDCANGFETNMNVSCEQLLFNK